MSTIQKIHSSSGSHLALLIKGEAFDHQHPRPKFRQAVMDHRRGLTRSNLQKSLAKLAHMRLGSKSNPTKESTSKTSFISTLPFELREMIFSYCDFYNSWKPEFRWKRGRGRSAMPPLIIALRPLPIPYHHALAVFYRRNRYTLGEMNNYGFGWMLPSAIATIQCINIDVV